MLDINQEQLKGEKESGDGVWSYDGDWRGKSNEQLAKETREFMSDEQALIIKEVISVAVPAIDALELADKYKNAKTDAEKQAILASALQIPVNKAGKVLKTVKSGKKADVEKEIRATQAEQRKATQTKATCTNGISCFTAGTLIETKDGLKAIETFTGGELIWTRNDFILEYGYRPVIATKATPDQPIFQVTVKNVHG
ncbi:hypothetical protein [Moraxella oblonga]|uniref:hypothetical protein n=1 Tax=Moraxella oblonga TaxID=200413 RepID=UPI00083734B0|nr:hypothetical protein [Moraxella oblonga]